MWKTLPYRLSEVEIAAQVVDHVIPPARARQWVLSLPKRQRIFLEEAERELRRQCPGAGPKARTGAVVFPHRFEALRNPHYHFHACLVEWL